MRLTEKANATLKCLNIYEYICSLIAEIVIRYNIQKQLQMCLLYDCLDFTQLF